MRRFLELLALPMGWMVSLTVLFASGFAWALSGLVDHLPEVLAQEVRSWRREEESARLFAIAPRPVLHQPAPAAMRSHGPSSRDFS